MGGLLVYVVILLFLFILYVLIIQCKTNKNYVQMHWVKYECSLVPDLWIAAYVWDVFNQTEWMTWNKMALYSDNEANVNCYLLLKRKTCPLILRKTSQPIIKETCTVCSSLEKLQREYENRTLCPQNPFYSDAVLLLLETDNTATSSGHICL